MKTLSALEPGKLRAAHLPPRGLEGDCADASVNSGWIRCRGSRGGTGRGVGGVRGAAPLSMSPAAHLHEPSVAQRVSSKPPRSLCARATVECHDVDAVRRTHRRGMEWNGTHRPRQPWRARLALSVRVRRFAARCCRTRDGPWDSARRELGCDASPLSWPSTSRCDAMRQLYTLCARCQFANRDVCAQRSIARRAEWMASAEAACWAMRAAPAGDKGFQVWRIIRTRCGAYAGGGEDRRGLPGGAGTSPPRAFTSSIGTAANETQRFVVVDCAKMYTAARNC